MDSLDSPNVKGLVLPPESRVAGLKNFLAAGKVLRFRQNPGKNGTPFAAVIPQLPEGASGRLGHDYEIRLPGRGGIDREIKKARGRILLVVGVRGFPRVRGRVAVGTGLTDIGTSVHYFQPAYNPLEAANMSTVSQIRDRLMEVFSQKQADVLAHVVVEVHDDLGTRADFNSLTEVVKDLAEAQKRTETRVEELAEAQKRTEIRVEELAEAQKRTETRVEELAEAQKHTETQVKSLAEAIIDLTSTQKKMLLRVDDHDGRSLEYILVRRLPSYVGVEFRKCRVIDNADLIDVLETRVSEDELKDILRTDIIATAKLEERPVHLVVEVSCTGHSSDVRRAARRAASLTAAGFPAIAMVACKKIASPAVVKAKQAGVRLLIGSKLRPEAA